jgi:hypothetical protein
MEMNTKKAFEKEYEVAGEHLRAQGFTDKAFVPVKGFIARAIMAFKAGEYPIKK